MEAGRICKVGNRGSVLAQGLLAPPCRKAYRRAVNLTRIMPPPRAQRGAAAHVWGRAGRGASPRMARRARPCSAVPGVADMSFFGNRA